MRLLRYELLKGTLGLLLLTVCSLGVKAQNEPQPDTTAPSDDVITEPSHTDTPIEKKSVYFTERQYQGNGGGPGQLQSRVLPDSVIKKLKNDKEFWYANYAFKEEKDEGNSSDTPFFDTTIFQTILWLLIIGGFAGCLIIYLSNSNVGLFRRESNIASAGEDTYVETDNIFEINYQREIDRAVANRNYRLAVRLLFLRTLKDLSDKRVIHYQHDRTNFDYLLQLYTTKYYKDFFRLTRSYEYCWYGQFDIDPGNYDVIKNEFETFERNLRS